MIQRGPPHRVRTLRQLGQRPGQQRLGPAQRARPVGRLGRPRAQLDLVQAGALGGVVDPGPDLLGPFQVPQGLGRRVAGQRRAGRVDRGRQGPGQVQRGVPVVGQRGRQGRLVPGQPGLAGQDRPVGRVQLDPLAGQHVLVDRVPGQRVPERVALAARVHLQQVVFHRLAQAREELGLTDPGHRGQ